MWLHLEKQSTNQAPQHYLGDLNPGFDFHSVKPQIILHKETHRFSKCCEILSTLHLLLCSASLNATALFF